MTEPLYNDIETIPSQRDDVKQRFEQQGLDEVAAIRIGLADKLADIHPPGNFKDPEKILAWKETTGKEKRAELEAKAEADIADAITTADLRWRKTALDGGFGQIAVIGFALREDEPMTAVIEGLALDQEAAMIRRFWTMVDRAIEEHRVRPTELQWVGHNNFGFDNRFILQRCIVHGIKPPAYFPTSTRPWDDQVYDTMLQWAGPRDRISMDTLCDVLGLAGKGTGLEAEGIDGSKVWDFVRDGRIHEVATYCEGDIRRTRNMHRRMVFLPSL